MSLQIKGINNLLKKVDNLSKIESEKAVVEVAKDMEKAIKERANAFSNNVDAIKAFEVRKYGNSTYIDVGLKADSCDWDNAKSLWFQQWGFYNYGWHFKGQLYIDNHKMWFDEAVKSIENECKNKLKQELKKQITQCWNG